MANLKTLRPILVAIVLGVVVYLGLLPIILKSLVGLPFAAKLLISGGLIVPLGFAMGMPFPTGLRLMDRPACWDQFWRWWWRCILD